METQRQPSTTNSRTPARKQISYEAMMYGKVPPQAKDLEEAILGAIMLEPGAYDIATELLRPECFYVDANVRIFGAMQSLQQKNQPIDVLTVVEELRSRDELEIVGGPYYVTKLTNSVVSSANIETHSRIIMQKFIKRELIRIGGSMVMKGYDDSVDVFNLLESTESDVYGISMTTMHKDFITLNAGMMEVVKDMEKHKDLESSLTGVPTGYFELDRLTNGWQPSDLVILAARPGVGKTAFALNLARNAATIPSPITGKVTPTAIFSLEMSARQLVQRILAAESETYLTRIKTGRMEEGQMKRLYSKGIHKLTNVPIFIDDTAGLSIYELRAKCRRLKNKHGVGMIIIDYLQLMSGDSNKSENREREISKISRELKKLAKDLDVPIIALSQLSREVEKRGKGQKVPQLSDLRESGAIEQDADMVAFVYRPPEDEVKEDAELRNKGMIKIAKHRHGELDEVVLAFHGEIQKWFELEDAKRYVAGLGSSFIPVPTESAKPVYGPNKITDDDLPF